MTRLAAIFALTAASTCAAVSAPPAAIDLYADKTGGLAFDGGRLSPELFTPGWGAVRQRGGEFTPAAPDGGVASSWSVVKAAGDKPVFTGRAGWTPRPDGTVLGVVSLECLSPCAMKTVALSLESPALPSVGEGDGTAAAYTASLGGGRSLSISFDAPVAFHCQDESQWSGAWKTRFGGRLDDCTFAPGDRIEWRVTLSATGGIALRRAEAVQIREGPQWSRLEYRKDILPGSALDFSALGLTDAPAGKYGWLRAVGDRFEFEGRPGVPVRFHGVNLCFSANFPDHATADRLVARLVASGYNSIRIHHHDGAWAAAYARRMVEGQRSKVEGLHLRPSDLRPSTPVDVVSDDIDRLDYLVARAIEAGLYLTTDLYVSRPVAWRDIGEERDGNVPPATFKTLIATHDGAFSNFCAYARAFLEHVNPYTGRAWKDEPAAPLLSLVNEGKPDEADERAAFERCAAFVRALGCRALLTNDNNGTRHAPGEGATPLYDFVDNHPYVDHPRFPDRQWALPARFDGANPVTAGKPAALRRGWGSRPRAKPYTATEWAFCAPSRRRGAGSLLMGALAAADGWDGLWRFAYAHDVARFDDGIALGPGYFDVALDPIAAAADRAVALLYLRGEQDFAPAAAAPGLSLDPDRGSAAIDLPLFCGGFAESGRVDAGPLSFEIESSATLFAASLDGAPVPDASRILLALLTDVQSAGTRFSDATRTEITAWGKGLLVENRDARVELRLAPGGPPPTVWAIATSGERLATVPSSYDPETGILRFTASTSQPFGGCLFHDIIRE